MTAKKNIQKSQSRWRRRCGCVASIIVTIEHRHQFLFMYTFLGHVNTNPDTLKLNTWYFRLLEFGVVYPVWNHAPPPPVSVVHTNSTNPSDPKKIHSGERFQKYAVSVCGFTDFRETLSMQLVYVKIVSWATNRTTKIERRTVTSRYHGSSISGWQQNQRRRRRQGERQ